MSIRILKNMRYLLVYKIRHYIVKSNHWVDRKEKSPNSTQKIAYKWEISMNFFGIKLMNANKRVIQYMREWS